ncbi:MAG: hypothetical protein UX78_C0001G0066 [Candidatus Amesbacteria bacterium GW2011_GWA2_47_11]|uniref:Uncharacterized protein n=1 Tax=Candidatus Amesbacteria bacterium GW2011_GWA2_47_11 TaxID=1618357 RepID=A0A0G1TS58_9BACT|nr:MAG: hypothetical protein UX78_C0001G0066 [Candidatus Amesbacteria bacterium GW2011_GWA2_47_11]
MPTKGELGQALDAWKIRPNDPTVTESLNNAINTILGRGKRIQMQVTAAAVRDPSAGVTEEIAKTCFGLTPEKQIVTAEITGTTPDRIFERTGLSAFSRGLLVLTDFRRAGIGFFEPEEVVGLKVK